MAEKQQDKKKGLPNRAARSHPSHVRRANSADRRIKRRKVVREDQHLRELENRERRREGLLTPWQKAKAKRAERRSADPFIMRKRRLHMAQALKMPTDAGHRA